MCILSVLDWVLSETSLRYIPEGGCSADNEISPCLVSMPENEQITPVFLLSRTCYANWDNHCTIYLLSGPPANVIPPVMVPGRLPNSNASRWSLTVQGSNCKVHEIGSQMGSFRLAERTRSLCDEAR